MIADKWYEFIKQKEYLIEINFRRSFTFHFLHTLNAESKYAPLYKEMIIDGARRYVFFSKKDKKRKWNKYIRFDLCYRPPNKKSNEDIKVNRFTFNIR